MTLQPWDDSGLDLLRALNTPESKIHLGGPESEAKLLDRQARYMTYHTPSHTEMLRIAEDGVIVGSVGYWQSDQNGEPAYETGWEILPQFNGRGIGTRAAAALMQRLQPIARHRHVFAFPLPANAGSNGICRKLGFELIGVDDVEYPKGTWSPHNIWRLDLKGWRYPTA